MTTTIPRFMQIHTLHGFTGALLNRDGNGKAKRLPFGGATRTRISSQCIKRHLRTAEDEFALSSIAGSSQAVRSRNIIGRLVIPPIREAMEVSEEVLEAVEKALNIGVYGNSGATEGNRQPLLVGFPEVRYLREKAEAVCVESPQDPEAAGKAIEEIFTRGGEGDNFQAFRKATQLAAGLESALWGRMVTSDRRANIDAAMHVAHSFTVHRQESESDYFSVVDDLQGPEEEGGAAFISDLELTTGLFYGYAVVDVPGLVSNLEGCNPEDWMKTDRELAGRVVHNLIRLITTVSPGAKLGPTAPYAYADMILLEAGNRQPRSLANAFRHPGNGQVNDAVMKVSDYLGKLDRNYGATEARKAMVMENCEITGTELMCLDDLSEWAMDTVRLGRAE